MKENKKKIRSIQKYLEGIEKNTKSKVYLLYRMSTNKGTVQNNRDRINLANAIFNVADDIETRDPFHKQVNILFDALNRVYDDLPDNSLDYVNP